MKRNGSGLDTYHNVPFHSKYAITRIAKKNPPKPKQLCASASILPYVYNILLDYRIWSPKSHPLAGDIQGKFGHAVGAILRCSSRSLRRPGKPHLRGNDTAVGTEGIVSPLLTRHPSSLPTLRQRLSSPPRPRWWPGFVSPGGPYRSKRRIRCGGMHAVLEGLLGDLLGIRQRICRGFSWEDYQGHPW